MMKKLSISLVIFLCSIGFACSIEPPYSYISILPENDSRVPTNTPIEIYFNAYEPLEDGLWKAALETDVFTGFAFHLVSSADRIPLLVKRESSERRNFTKLLLSPEALPKSNMRYELIASRGTSTFVISRFMTGDIDATAPVWLGVSEIRDMFGDLCFPDAISLELYDVYDDYDDSGDIEYGLFLSNEVGEIDYGSEPSRYLTNFLMNDLLISINKLTEQFNDEGAFTKIGIRPVDRVGNWGRSEEFQVDLSQSPYIFKIP